MGRKKQFIMVAGNPRSGTTFVGKMLALPISATYFSEPFNAEFGMPAVKVYFPYIGKSNDEMTSHHKQVADDFINGKAKFRKYKASDAENVKQLVGRSIFGTKNNYEYQKFLKSPAIKTGIIKDPTASLMAEYLHKMHDVPVVVVLRHPGAVVGSFKRLNITHSVANLLSQPALELEHLKDYLTGVNPHNLNHIEQAAWHWNCINHVLLDFVKKNKNMIVVRHEDLSENPITEFRKLYEKLGLKFTDRIERIIAEHTSAHNPTAAPEGEWHQLKRNSKENIHRWHETLTQKEAEIVRSITSEIADKFYDKSTWQPQYATTN